MARYIFSLRNIFHYRNKPPLDLIANSFPPIRTVATSHRINSNHQEKKITVRNFLFSEKEAKDFDVVFPEMIEQYRNMYADVKLKPAVMRLNEILDYNMPGGTKMRGLFAVKAYKALAGQDKCNAKDLYLANVLGWLLEMLGTHYLMSDDVIDQSETRRGKLCWYKKVGWTGVGDGFMVETTLFTLLKHYFQGKPYYVNIFEIFNEITFVTTLGETLDLMTSPTVGKVDLNLFTLETYKTIAKYKTALYSFYLPIGLGMFMTGITDQKIHNKAKEVGVEIGMLFQVQDDYFDCYGDPADLGKNLGKDIKDGKCSWLIVQALQLANAEQEAILKENYRTKDPAGVAKVKAVYDQLQLKSIYKRFETEQYQKIMKMIDSFDSPALNNLFTEFTNGIYGRNG